MSDISRPTYRDLRLYAGDTGPCAVDLSDNTNLWGTPPAAAAMLANAGSRGLRTYPEPYSESLKRALARYAGVDPSQVVTGAGSDDILDCTFRALAEPGARVAYVAPTFVMVPVFAKTNGLDPVAVPLTPEYDADVDALLAIDARITYLCSPNNPTGGLLSRAALEQIITRSKGFVVIDEAYVDFAGRSAVELLSLSPRLVIARTFSKAFALASLRVGYALTSAEVALELEKARGPYKVGVLGAEAAELVLETDLGWVRDRAARAIQAREQLRRDLAARGIWTPASDANFVFAPMPNAQAVAASMRARGVAVRAFSNLPLLDDRLRASNGDAFRITVGPPEAMAALLEALDAALAEQRRS